MSPEPVEESKMPDGRPRSEQPKWRKDFPVDTAEDEYTARRDFVKFLVLISGAFVVGQLWIVWRNIVRRRQGKPAIQRIADARELPVGEAVTFSYPAEHDQCILLRTGRDSYIAYSQECTHLACAVLPDMQRGLIVCPCHEGYFDLPSGYPVAGPPRRPLPRITLETRGDAIYATGVELRT